MLDKVGKEIPNKLVAVFKRPGLLIAIEKNGELCFDVLSRIDSGDELFGGIQRATIEAAFKDITNLLRAELPYAVCDWCEGSGCMACKDKGWLGRFLWEMTPRKE